MRNLGLLSALAATAALLAGCGGGGGGSSKKVTRTVAGFVYVLGSTGTANPNAIVIPSAVAPAGFFAPTAGTVTVSVADGVITRSPDQEIFLMTSSNAIICSATTLENANVSVSGSGLQYNGAGRSFTPFNANIGTKANTGTVLVLNNGGSTYTPGAPASLKYTVNGVIPTDPTVPFISGDADSSLAVIALDASGVIVPSATFTVAATNAGVAVGGTNPGAGPFSLTPGPMSQAEGLVDVTIDTVGANLQATINGNFTHGTATSMTLGTNTSTVTWGTVAPAVANTTATLTATVKNQFGVGMPGLTITFTNAKAPANTWAASPGTNYTAISNGGVSDASGVVTATFNPPDAKNAVLTAGEKAAKGISTATATSGAAVGTVDITVLRPIGALVISGPSRVDTGTTTGQYTIDGATDVDGDTAAVPSGGVTWNRVNAAANANVGNTGDVQAGTVANSTISGTGLLTAGTAAGQTTVSASIGAVNSNNVVTQVFGVPSKIILNPDTATSLIGGASGEYAFGSVGAQTAATFTLQDSSGHVIPGGEYAGFTSAFTIQALTGGSITPGGVNVSGFTVTCGNTDGTFTVQVNGTWTGSQGGSGSINLTRAIGQNAP